MAIADGQKIAIRFTQPLVGNVLGLDPPVGYTTRKVDMSTAAVSVQATYSTSYPPSNAIDTSTSTYWMGSATANWFQTQFQSARVITKIRLYLGQYYIKAFTFSGSNDGDEWTQIGGTYNAAKSTTAQWYEFDIDNSNSYLYYRINISSSDTYSAYYFYIYELELYELAPMGNHDKFTISFDEYDMVPEGLLSRGTRSATGIEHYCSFDKDLDLSSGSYNGVAYERGTLSLAVDEGG